MREKAQFPSSPKDEVKR